MINELKIIINYQVAKNKNISKNCLIKNWEHFPSIKSMREEIKSLINYSTQVIEIRSRQNDRLEDRPEASSPLICVRMKPCPQPDFCASPIFPRLSLLPFRTLIPAASPRRYPTPLDAWGPSPPTASSSQGRDQAEPEVPGYEFPARTICNVKLNDRLR